MIKIKYIEEKLMRVLMLLSVALVLGAVVSVIYSVFRRGIPSLSWEMVTSLPGGGFYIGKEGGFLNAIVGSVYIVGASTLLGLIIAIPVVFYLNVYLKPESRFGRVARLSYDVLFGVPSIVYGAFGFTIMIFLRTSYIAARWYHSGDSAHHSHSDKDDGRGGEELPT
jgi:phosphate transport system permease protein